MRVTAWTDAATLERLASNPGQGMRMPPLDRIDHGRPFLPEEYTQLYYTPVYRSLHREHRLRYNQLFGMRINEYIMMLEADLVERLLAPLCRRRDVAADPALVRCIGIMIAEEKRHYQCFLALNRAAHPELYAGGRERFFSKLPAATRASLGAVGLLSRHLPFALWYLMAMEESSTALARAMAQNPGTDLGPLEPTFVEVHREHMRDETRHLQVDGLLAEVCLAGAGRRRRALNAHLFKRFVAPMTRPTRGGSGIKVIRRLVSEMPELSWREKELTNSVLALRNDRAFQTSLFNREAMPLTFGVFDRAEELGSLGEVIVGYDRR
jgi:hypothetical protein